MQRTLATSGNNVPDSVVKPPNRLASQRLQFSDSTRSINSGNGRTEVKSNVPRMEGFNVDTFALGSTMAAFRHRLPPIIVEAGSPGTPSAVLEPQSSKLTIVPEHNHAALSAHLSFRHMQMPVSCWL